MLFRSPTELGGAPFALAANSAMTLWASELGLSQINRNARAYVLPCIAGHVGADTAGVILSETPHLSDEIMLVVDVGTNAEIFLGNSDRILAASSPTGPTFEGAQISSGQRAAPGAIERVRIDPETFEPRIKMIDGRHWSTDDGFADEIEAVPVTGICGSGVIEAIAKLHLAGVVSPGGTIEGDLETNRVIPDKRTFSYVLWHGPPRILITQADVRAVQLAKAALYAGARLLMDHFGTETVDQVRLAGAFGNHIDPKYAMVLGMIPDCPIERVSSAGNAAGTGARIALLNSAARREIETVVRQIEKIETAVEPRFQEHFVNAIAVPHKTDAYPNLETLVTLPKVSFGAAGGGGGENGGRRRRRKPGA